MIEIGNKEKIINILEKFESGLTYKNLLQRYKAEYGNELKKGYVYLKRLKEKSYIESYKAQNTIGKTLTYKLTAKSLRREPIDLELKGLKFLNNLFKDNVDYLMKNDSIVKEILGNSELIENIDKVVKNSELSRVS